MLAACILFMGAVLTRNPTAIGGDSASWRGIFLLTRHPMLWSFTIRAAAPFAAGAALWVVLLVGHPDVIGVSPLHWSNSPRGKGHPHWY